MDLYTLNKNMVQQLPTLEITNEVINKINKLHNKKAYYYMMLCNDMKYYTILKATTNKTPGTTDFGTTVIDCLNNVGEIKSIELVDDDNAIEIWVSIPNEDENELPNIYCMYLFPYDEGVVLFNG